MTRITEWTELRDQLKSFSIWLISCALDVTFLALWATVQWAVNEKLIKNLQLTGIDVWVFLCFQILLAVTSLVPVVLYVYVDVRIKWLRARAMIQKEEQRSRSDVPNA